MIELLRSDITPYSSINELRRLVGDWVRENLREPVLNAPQNTLIQFNKDSRRHPVTSMAPGRVADLEEARLLATLGLRQALAEARHDHQQPKKPTDAADVIQIHIYLTDIKLDGTTYKLRLVVKEKTGGHYFYDHIVALPADNEKPPAP